MSKTIKTTSANKTTATPVPVSEFLQTITEPRRSEAETLTAMMRRITNMEPVMWGPTMIGFGSYGYVYESGRSGTSFRLGFAPRKAELVIYIVPGFSGLGPELAEIGPHRHEKSCLYLRSLAKTHLPELEALAGKAWLIMQLKYPD